MKIIPIPGSYPRWLRSHPRNQPPDPTPGSYPRILSPDPGGVPEGVGGRRPRIVKEVLFQSPDIT
eukprot:942434-Prorocentrum_minimum.AAC.1